jgi:uncharacterized protein (DUF2141 family)
MKRINPVVVLLVIIGLASGFLLLQDSMLLRTVGSGWRQNVSASTKATVAVSSSKAATVLREDIVRAEGPDSKTELANAGGSVTVASATFATAEVQEMTFCVTGLTAKTSSVYVAMFESQEGFPKSELSSKTTVVSATEDQVQFLLELPRNQPVAIAVFQDIDGNGKLSKNQIGIPTEPYGFSNNARGLLGPPSFSDAVFTISDDRDSAQPIEIKVR